MKETPGQCMQISRQRNAGVDHMLFWTLFQFDDRVGVMCHGGQFFEDFCGWRGMLDLDCWAVS